MNMESAFTCRVCEQKLESLSTHLCSEPRMPGIRNYEVLKRLGKGSFGTVFLARKKQTQDLFAIKILTKGHEKKKWIYAERNSLVSIYSPYTVKLYSAFQTRQHVYLVLEYIPGTSLETIVKSNKNGILEGDAKLHVAQLLLATKDLHNQNISHRDLKPENILIDEDGCLKLVDFGYSTSNASVEQVAEDQNSCTKRTDLRFTAVGTPLYTPPETMLLAAQGYDSKKVDSWSIGVILFELLTGRVPFTAKDYPTFRNLMRKYLSEDQEPSLSWPESCCISKEAKDLVHQLLHPNPQQRLSIDEARKHPFFENVPWERLENVPSVPRRKKCAEHFTFVKDLDDVVVEEKLSIYNVSSLAFYPDFDYFSIQNFKELNMVCFD